MRCDQCQHWQNAERDWEAERAGFRQCAAIIPGWKITGNEGREYPNAPEGESWRDPTPPARQALLDEWEQRDVEATKQARAYVMDGSEYRAELWTGPDFFCARFAA